MCKRSFVFAVCLWASAACGASVVWNASAINQICCDAGDCTGCDGCCPAEGYRVYYGIASDQLTTIWDNGGSTVFDIPDMWPTGTYFFGVRAYNASGESGWATTDTGQEWVAYTKADPPPVLPPAPATDLRIVWQKTEEKQMAGTIVQTAGPVDYDGQLTFGSAVTAGNTIIVMMGGRAGDPTVSDSRSNTYSAPLGNRYYASKDSHVKIYFASNVAAGSTTISMSSVFNGSWIAWEVSGLATTGQPDAQAEGDYASGTTPNVSITTTDAATFLVVACSDFGNDERVLSGAYGDIATSVSSTKNGVAFGYANLTSSGSKTAGLTFAATDGWAVQAYAFKLASGGGASAAYDASKQDIALSINSPTVTATQSASYSVSKQDLSLSTKASTQRVSVNTTVGKKDLSLSVSAPTIQASTILFPSKQDLTLSALAPQISASPFIPAAKQDLALSVLEPTVSAGLVVEVGKQDLTLEINPLQVLIDAFSAQNKQDLTLSINAAGVSTSAGVQIDAGKQDLTLLINASQARSDAFYLPSAQSLALSINAPSCASDCVQTASKQDLTLSVNQAAVSTSSALQVVAGKQDLSFSVQAPQVRLDPFASISKQDLTLSINAASVSTAADISAVVGKQDLALSINAATVSAQEQGAYSASCQNLALSLFASLQVVDCSMAVGKQDLALSINAPTVSIDEFYQVAQQTIFLTQQAFGLLINHNIAAGKQDLTWSVRQALVSVAQVEGQLIALVNTSNMQPMASVSAYQPRVVAS